MSGGDPGGPDREDAGGDPLRRARDAARRRLARVERALGVATEGAPDLWDRLRAARFALAPGGRRRALVRLAEGLRTLLEATQEASAWRDAQTTYQRALLARLARGAPRRPWRDAEEEPAVLLGTGGGGTRVLAETAVRMGLFLGPAVNESFDSLAWAPLVYDLVTSTPEAVDLPTGDVAGARLLETARAAYAPWAAVGERFGWKLPEILLVLPWFFDAFPRARAVLLVRHPLSAAFRRPHVTTTPEHPLGRVVLPAAYRAAGRDPALVAADPPWRRQALAWRHQVGRAERWLAASVPAERVLVLRLEAFALDPAATHVRLAGHLGLPAPRAGEATVFDPGRERRRPEPAAAREVLALCGEVAERVGYGPGWLDAPWEAPRRRDLFAAYA